MAHPRRRLPATAREALPAKARVMSWCEFDDGTVAVVTRAEFLLIGPDGVQVERVWGDVDHAALESDTQELTLIWVDGAAPTVLRLPALPGAEEFSRAVKERVDHSLVHQEIEKLPGSGVLRGAIRRNPDGSLFSQVTVSGTSTPPADIDQRAKALEDRVRASVGLDT